MTYATCPTCGAGTLRLSPPAPARQIVRRVLPVAILVKLGFTLLLLTHCTRVALELDAAAHQQYRSWRGNRTQSQ